MTLLAPALAKAIRNLPADDRSFTGAVSSDGLADAVKDLRLELSKRKDNLAGDIVEAYRKFLRSGMTGERCAENVSRFTPRYLSEANTLLFNSSTLKPEELNPSGAGGRADTSDRLSLPFLIMCNTSNPSNLCFAARIERKY
jgi:hypothetical protein